jgi:hypothetical protein
MVLCKGCSKMGRDELKDSVTGMMNLVNDDEI